MKSETPNRKAAVPTALLVAVVSISFAAIFFRKAAPTHPLVCAGIRLVVASILLAPLTIRSMLRGTVDRRLILCAVGAGLAYGVHFGAWVASLGLTTVAASVTLVTTTPLILAVVALVTGRDKPQGRIWGSLALAVLGLVLIGGTDFGSGTRALLGDGLAFVGALAIAIYMTIGRRLGEKLDLWAFSGIATAVGGISLLSTAALAGISLAPVSGESFFYIVLAAIIPQLLGHNLITWTLRHTKPSVVAMAVVGEPVGATVLAWLWLGETVSPAVILGCGITLAAVLLAVSKTELPEPPALP
jgi:drug/metabolite transporter (DMT)-like permease